MRNATALSKYGTHLLVFPYKLFREDGEQDYKEHHDNDNVHFVVTMGAKDLEKAVEQGLVELIIQVDEQDQYEQHDLFQL